MFGFHFWLHPKVPTIQFMNKIPLIFWNLFRVIEHNQLLQLQSEQNESPLECSLVVFCRIHDMISFWSWYTQGIAKRLVRAALHEAAKKREMSYQDIKRIEKGIRRHFHDDITVIVIYLDHHKGSSNRRPKPSTVNGTTNAPTDIFSLKAHAGDEDLLHTFSWANKPK